MSSLKISRHWYSVHDNYVLDLLNYNDCITSDLDLLTSKSNQFIYQYI